MSTELRILFCTFYTLMLLSCQNYEPPRINYNSIEQELLQDTAGIHNPELIREIVAFFKREIPHHYSQRIRLGSGRNMVYLDELTDYQIDSIRDHLGSNTRILLENVPDSQFVDENYLLDRIRHALTLSGKYPWNQSIPDSIFLNYLMPYKIINEYPGNWWAYLTPHYRDSMAWWSSPSYDRFNVSDIRLIHDYTTFYMGDLPEWWAYDAIAQTYTPFPSLKEILLLRYGGCQMESMINAMILRTWGVPAVVDEVIYWGSQNGSHTAEVIWNPELGKMDSGHDFYFTNTRRRPSKVIRHSYRKTGVYTKMIAPYLHGAELQIPQMKNDHWFDVTAEHCPAGDLVYPVGDQWPVDLELGYIYVMNYGNWMPVSYGIRENENIRFRNMGKDIMYRIGYFNKGEHHFTTIPFLLDQNGELQYSTPLETQKMAFNASKINHGSKSGVEPGETYTLQYLDREGNWQDHMTLRCEKEEELWFEDVPMHAFYRLQPSSDEWSLARPFLISDEGEQLWY